jgi:Tfp pilus assembly protein PilF
VNNRLGIVAAGLFLALSLGACASVPQALQGGAALGSLHSAQDRVHGAIELLHRGEENRARSLLEAALRQEPGNVSARRLLEEIETDPVQQLGERSRAYVVRDTDTMTGLAERFVGDPLMFYALARYNHIVPNDLATGQTIRVPDHGRPAQTAAHAPPAVTSNASVAPPSATPPPAAPAATTTNAAAVRANRLRLRGLELLNAGDVDQAVAVLGQARALDANSSAIQNDLARAQRIQATLHAQ